jgi:hypothetical protein
MLSRCVFKKILWILLLSTWLQSMAHAGILSLGALRDVTSTRAKVSYYEEWGNALQNIGFQFDLYSYSDSRAYSQISLRHINLENNVAFYRAAPLEKTTIGLGLNLDNYYSQSQLFFNAGDLAHSAGLAVENFSAYVFGQNQGLGAAELQMSLASSDRIFKANALASVVQQDAMPTKTYFHGDAVGLSVSAADWVKLSYETGQQLATQTGSLVRLELGPQNLFAVYHEINEYHNGFIPKYVSRLYQNSYVSNQLLTNRNLNGQFYETGFKLTVGDDYRLQMYQRQDQNAAWGGSLLWAVSETVFLQYEYEKPLPLYNLADFQTVEFQKFSTIFVRHKDAQFVFQFQKFINNVGVSADDFAIEYLLKL